MKPDHDQDQTANSGRLPALDPRDLAPIGANIAPDALFARAITFDSRACDEHTAFGALPGEKAHGNDFIAAALEKGAPFVISDRSGPRHATVPDPTSALRWWARRRRDRSGAFVVGITGSAGKTTAKEYVAAALEAGRTPGNLNTLNAIACYLLSSDLVGVRQVIEMGVDRLGEMTELVALVGPDFGVVTAVGPAHLQALGSVEAVAAEKGVILEGRPGLVSEQASPYYPSVPSYGFGSNATFRGEALGFQGDALSFHYQGVPVRLATPSTRVAEAALLGLVLAERQGIDLQAAAARLEAVSVPGGRMRFSEGRITLLDDSYNANPLSVRAALESLTRLKGRRVAILGDMRELGENAARYHAEIGAEAGRTASVVVAVGEHATTLAEAAAAQGASTTALPDAAAALGVLDEVVRDGDAVLVKASNSIGLATVAEALRARL
jgi:UDP-N-acetylmuramoyl-tripeptide--D-alanyl-D-alanine ligase